MYSRRLACWALIKEFTQGKRGCTLGIKYHVGKFGGVTSLTLDKFFDARWSDKLAHT